MEQLASYLFPLLFFGLGVILLFGRHPYFDAFLKGGAEGLETAFHLLPTLTALVSAVAMLRACGVMEAVARLLAPALAKLGVPAEVIPLILLRPVSGGASTAQLNDLFASSGPDSPAGLLGSVLVGSSETVFYVTAVYFGAVGVRKTRYALPCALLVMTLSIVLSVLVTNRFFHA